MKNGPFRITSTLRRIIVNTGWLFSLRVLRILVGLFVSVWVARYLGPDRFGSFSYAIAFITLFTPIAQLGLKELVVRDIVREPAGRAEIMGTAFFLRLGGGAIAFAGASLSILLVRDEQVVRFMTAIVAFGLLFSAFETIELWFQSKVEAKYPVVARAVALIVASAAKVAMILLRAPVVAFAAVAAFEMVAIAAGFLVVYRLRGFRLAEWRFRLARARELLAQCWTLVLAGVLSIIYLRIDQVMLGGMLGDGAVGVYSTAVRLSEVWYFVPIAISTSVFPALVRARERDVALYGRRLQQLYDFLAGLALVTAIAVTIVAGPLVRILFGEQYAGAAPILSIHIWAGLFVFLRAGLGRWLITEGYMTFFFYSNAIGCAANVLLNLYLIPRYGGIGAAAASIVTYFLATFGACLVYRPARPAGRMMALALAVPVRAPLRFFRRKRDA